MRNIISIYACCIFCLSLSSVFSQQQVNFSDVSEQMGIINPVQIDRGGISFYDFDDDGYDDYSLATGQGDSLYFFKNNGNIFNDLTGQMGIGLHNLTREILWADYDNDGDQDVFVCNEGSANKLYRNNGAFNFEDVTTQAGFPIWQSYTNAACWGDYNNDGLLDIYVTHYNEFIGNYLYKNNGDGTFQDVTFQAGVADKIDSTGLFRLALAVAFLDYNNDGWQDIYIANDKYNRNTLYKNNGDGTFTDVSIESGTNVSGFFMGVAIGDYDNNGYLDIYSTNDPPGNALLKNNGDGTFTNVAEQLGVSVYKSCWGTNFLDYDNDGDLDLYVSVVGGSPILKNPLFENLDNGNFQEVNNIGLEDSYKSYGNSIGDFNNDGYYDIAVFNNIYNCSLYKSSGGTNNWIKMNLKGVESNKDGIGSIIYFYYGNKQIMRSTHCGQSYCGQNSNNIIIGVGQATIIDSIKIKWPLGLIDTYYNIGVDQLIIAVEGESLTGVDDDKKVNKQFSLNQNYPNPFNPTTKIKYTIPSSTIGTDASLVTLKVYDILGNEVSTLVNKEQSAGTYNVDFDATNLGSGVYFYTLQTGEFIETKKMLLLR